METVVFASHLPGPRLRHRILHVVSEEACCEILSLGPRFALVKQRADMSNALRHPSKTLFSPFSGL